MEIGKKKKTEIRNCNNTERNTAESLQKLNTLVVNACVHTESIFKFIETMISVHIIYFNLKLYLLGR
jgi:hypothetical protein